eukprot:364918-Chlamydomonas_euryale.AAC.9
MKWPLQFEGTILRTLSKHPVDDDASTTTPERRPSRNEGSYKIPTPSTLGGKGLRRGPARCAAAARGLPSRGSRPRCSRRRPSANPGLLEPQPKQANLRGIDGHGDRNRRRTRRADRYLQLLRDAWCVTQRARMGAGR